VRTIERIERLVILPLLAQIDKLLPNRHHIAHGNFLRINNIKCEPPPLSAPREKWGQPSLSQSAATPNKHATLRRQWTEPFALSP
jgi:hypothetical protein